MKKTVLKSIGVFISLFIVLSACSNVKTKKQDSKLAEQINTFTSSVIHPDWSKNITLYEVNLRQFTAGGTITAFMDHLPRLKTLGVDVLWFMPIHPIGIQNRKGELGSYYSVMDFMDVNPEFGTLEEFKGLLNQAHEMGFYVLIDWVPNHTSWDNPIARDHPDWYLKDSSDNFIPPIGTDWTDVIQLDWSQSGLHDYMIEALSFWIKLGVDGFRVDHPHKTPKEFWERARIELDEIKPVLMLAENEDQTYFLEQGFDMNYAWELHHIMNEVAQGKKEVSDLKNYFNKESKLFPKNVYRLIFLSNHDENSWQGTINERMGDAHRAFAVFMFTIPGTPLLYNGQEACLDKRLKFFERDPIDWKECDLTEFYRKLIRLKKDNIALWNGEFGGDFEFLKTENDKVIAYYRDNPNSNVLVILNLSDVKQEFVIYPGEKTGNYKDFFTGDDFIFNDSLNLELEAWNYLVIINN